MAQGATDQSNVETADPEENSPNMIVYRKVEDIITRMQDDKTGGVPIRTVKSFLSKIPSVVTEPFFQLREQDLLWEVKVWHLDNVTSPAELLREDHCLNQYC